jgi:hypothetical protein
MKRLLIALPIFLLTCSFFNKETGTINFVLKQADFEIVTAGITTFNVSEFGNVYKGRNNCIIKVSEELKGLTGIKMPYNSGLKEGQTIQLKFKENVILLAGVFADSTQHKIEDTKAIDSYITDGKAGPEPIIKNGLTVAGLPSVNVYPVKLSKGIHTLKVSNDYLVLGIIKTPQQLPAADAGLPDGRAWEPFTVEGFGDDEPLFEIVGGHDGPVIDSGMAGTEDILGGFESGACVKIGDTLHVFPTERAGEKGVAAFYDRVKTRIGHWTSTDAVHWTRQQPLYTSSGTYAVADEDNPLNDRRGAIWSYTPVFNKTANKWYGYYLAYTVSKEIEPNHSFGRIWRCESTVPGLNGIAGPYTDMGIIMEPGLDTQLWEGRQGVDSFFPYFVHGEWLALYGGAYPFQNRDAYPYHGKRGGWYVGLAKSKSLEGPWKRMDTTVNPVKSMHPWFIENPLISQLPNGSYIAIFDGGPQSLRLPNIFGYSLSKDGFHWSEAHYFPIETKLRKWWNTMRTPLSLLPGEKDRFTILFTAINDKKRFRPMGMVQVKLNARVLEQKMKSL